ncbi:MAG TPA: sigma-70 family RNA polymerase sigma factor [Thermoflexales bacterium]|nr:sigma-70 family RNA polymerase sigma factor [Thermoflexales bacterium]HQY25754.1 sigma-70 family RNA polymerase sigma factor [Thermoflexales bacterium]
MALIGRIQLGDGEAIEFFCQEFGQAIARYSRRFANTLSLEEIEDIAQVTLIGAIEGIDRFQSNSSLRTWVLRIAHHKLVDAVRRGGSRDRREIVFAEMPEEWEPEFPELPEDLMVTREQQQRVAAALSALPDLERAVITLRYIEDMDTLQISEIINKSHRSTQKLLTDARAHLRLLLSSGEAHS